MMAVVMPVEHSQCLDLLLAMTTDGLERHNFQAEVYAMRILIVEDDFVSRNILQHILAEYGQCDIAVDGQEAVDAFKRAWGESEPYDLICMDIMMPNLNGHEALAQIRAFEQQMEIDSNSATKVIMTTALNDNKNVSDAFYKGAATSYFVKPIDRRKMVEELRLLGLISA